MYSIEMLSIKIDRSINKKGGELLIEKLESVKHCHKFFGTIFFPQFT
jgi:hypothetical protein